MREKRSIIFVLLTIAPFFFGCNGNKTSSKTETKDSARVAFSTEEEALLDTVQKQTFEYFWDGAEPHSGLARERIHMDNIYPQNDQNVVTLGGSGFGIMAILVGVKRGFITREEAFSRYQNIVDFLSKADRFHGAWPHWLDGETGKVKPVSYTHLRAHETRHDLVCRLLLEKKKKQ